MKFLAYLPLLIVCLSCSCYAQSISDGLTVTGGPVATGIGAAGETQIKGGGIATSQAIYAGITGGAAASVFYGAPPTATTTNATTIGGGQLWTSGLVRSGSVFESMTQNGAFAGLRIAQAGLTDWYVFNPAGVTHLDFWQSGTSLARLQADGKFLLGSSMADAGAYKLQVTGNAIVGSATGGGSIRINAANSQQAELQFYNQATSGYAIYRPASSTDLRFYHPSAGDSMSLTSAGSVGIGTTAPASRLEVNGTVTAAGLNLSAGGANGYWSGPSLFGPSAGPLSIRSGNATSSLRLGGSHNQDHVYIASNGFVGIGNSAPTNRLTVSGTISAMEVKVTATGADYVFDSDYKLRSLSEVEAFVKEHHHLPEIPSAKSMQSEGMGLSEVVVKQLAKIEELTLYAIQAKKERDAMEGRLVKLEALMRDLKK